MKAYRLCKLHLKTNSEENYFVLTPLIVDFMKQNRCTRREKHIERLKLFLKHRDSKIQNNFFVKKYKFYKALFFMYCIYAH